MITTLALKRALRAVQGDLEDRIKTLREGGMTREQEFSFLGQVVTEINETMSGIEGEIEIQDDPWGDDEDDDTELERDDD